MSNGGEPAPPPARKIGVAIAIPEPWGFELQTWRKTFGDPLAGAIPTHITVLPPTLLDARYLPAVDEHLRDVAARERPFPIRLRGTASFRPLSPVVFVQLVQGIGDCERLEAQVRSGPLARVLDFYYHPHVTIAHHLPDAVLDRAFDELGDYDATFEAMAFSLYEHGPDGVWRPQRDYLLGSPLPGPRPPDADH